MAGRSLRLVHPRSGRVLAERLRVPRTFLGRALGLMFRRELPAGDGMWITPCNGIHMFCMRFAIDAVFLDRRLRVVRVRAGLRPWRVVPLVLRAHSVVELPAGTVADLGLERGEELSVEPAARTAAS
jgi:uncharacterized protein